MTKSEQREQNLSTILDKSHDDKWVAIAPDYSRVVAAASTLRELVKIVAESDVIFHRVLPRGVGFIGSFF